MKLLVFSALFSLSSFIAVGQIKEGKVIYERTSQLNIQLGGAAASNPELARMLPKSQTSTFELLFSNNQSLWQNLPDVNQEASQVSGMGASGNGFVINRMTMDEVVYHNFETGKKLSSREFSSKKYLIEDTIAKNSWKISEESRTILGRKAIKAVTEVYTTRNTMTMENGEMKRVQLPDTLRVTAWFTPEIPVSAGPAYQGQLPGLVLELDINNGRTLYKAVEISPKVSVASIKEPKGGKKITQAEFQVEQDKMQDEMRKRLSESGGRVIIGQ